MDGMDVMDGIYYTMGWMGYEMGWMGWMGYTMGWMGWMTKAKPNKIEKMIVTDPRVVPRLQPTGAHPRRGAARHQRHPALPIVQRSTNHRRVGVPVAVFIAGAPGSGPQPSGQIPQRPQPSGTTALPLPGQQRGEIPVGRRPDQLRRPPGGAVAGR